MFPYIGNFFLVMPLANQIYNYLRKNKIPYENSRERDRTFLSNVTDGAAYIRLIENGTIAPDYLSFQWNCDEMPVFNSSGYSTWPIQLMINELMNVLHQR